MKKTLLAAVLATAATGAFASPAAGTNGPGPLDTSCGSSTSCQSTFNVTAQIVSTCASIQAYDIDFGQHFPATTAAGTTYDQVSKIEVLCNNTVPYMVSLDSGTNNTGNGTSTIRRVGDATNGDFMDYNLYQPSAANPATGDTTTLWGDGTTNGTKYSGTGTGVLQPLAITGRLYVLQTSQVGEYSDIVTAVMTF